MKLRFYCLAVLVILCQSSYSQSVPNFNWVSGAIHIGNTHGDTVRITPAQPNNYHQVETQVFNMPTHGQGVAGVRFGLHGADGGKATYSEAVGGPWTANAGAGGTIWVSLTLDGGFDVAHNAGPYHHYQNKYGLPFFVTYGKNGESGGGSNYAPYAGGGGGSTGMAWLFPGFAYGDYNGNASAKGLAIAIASGGGGGEVINANIMADGGGGGIPSSSTNSSQLEQYTLTCSPYSVQIASGASIMGYYPASGTSYDPCVWGTISANEIAFQAATGGGILTAFTLGQPGGRSCQWTGGPPASGNAVQSLGCEGSTTESAGKAGGAGFTGGGASSAGIAGWYGWVGAGGGGTGTTLNFGYPGYLHIAPFIQDIIPSYGGDNYACSYGYGVNITNGGQTGNPASGWFEYYTIPDTTAPVVHLKNATIYLDDNGNVTLTAADVDAGSGDNDSISHFDFSPSGFNCSGLGVHRILVTAYDFAGNSASAYDTVTVLNNKTPHYAGTFYLLPTTIDVGTAPYTLQQSDFPVLVDNCYPSYSFTYTWAPTTFTCAQAGTSQTVNFTVTTPDGRTTNTSTQFYVVNNFTSQIIYVDSAATGANTGLNWQDAFTSLQQALTAGCTGNKKIYVAEGTYYPDHGPHITAGDRNASFIIPDGDEVYGGFANGGDVFDNRNPTSHPVMLSGAIGAVPSTSYSYHVVTVPKGSTNVRLEGLTIANGYTNTTANIDGGSILKILSSNVNPVPVASVVNCTLGNGHSPYGAAVFFNDSAAAGSITLQNCFFKNNAAPIDGGAVYINGSGTLQTKAFVTNCVFLNNTADRGGAVATSNSAATITNCSFGSNRAILAGGALSISGTSNQVNIYNTVMYADTATAEIDYNGGQVQATIAYSDIQGSGGSTAWNTNTGINGGQNIDADPQILPVIGTLEVLLSSPLRNAGNNSYNTTAYDIKNLLRIQQDTIDIGAYEPGSIVYVAWDAANGGDGKSWATALNNLQDGLDSAISSAGIINNSRQVWVKKGTYYPTRFQGSNQGRLNTFYVQYSEKIYGGFAGNESSITQRNIPANPTILSGDLGVLGDSSDNAYHVVTLNEYSPTLDGFIIQNGNANHPSNYSMKYGGGLADYNYSFVVQSGSPVIRNCVFRNNLAIDGGAVSFETTDKSYSAAFVQCLFYGNTANDYGGAVYLQNGGNFGSPSNLTCNFINCTATNNTSTNFSGGFVENLNINGAGSTLSNFYNCLIWGNTTGFNGPAYDNTGTGASTLAYNSDLQGVNPVFVNAANPAGADGLIFTSDDGLKLQTSSPVINGGNNAYLSTGNMNDSLYDVTGSNRVQQQVADMGAYENWGCLGFTKLYVDSSIAVSGLGNSWATAFKSLQDALQVLNVCPEVDTIFLATGTYYPGPTNSSISRDITFLINRAVTILGGYPSGGGVRNVIANPVSLDGNINGPSFTDNASHVMCIVDATANDTVTLDGITFNNSYGYLVGTYTINGQAIDRASGGGLVIKGPAVIIRNCSFSNNKVFQGGGAIIDYAGNLMISNSVFSVNSAGYGGAVRTEQGCSLTATGNTFFTSRSQYDGGALSIFMNTNDVATLINNQFMRNLSVTNGAAGTLDGGTSNVYNNTFFNNTAIAKGGALYLMPASSTSTVHLVNNLFFADTAHTGGNDLYNSTANTTVIQNNNSFSDTDPGFYNAGNLPGADNLWGTSDDGLQLAKTSTLINQGTGAVVNYNTDITGAQRIKLGTVDIGAFEADSEVTRWYVSVAQDSVTGDGLSWATAFPQFTQGVIAAKPGDSVWVAGGIYAPLNGTSLHMKSGVAVYGGFNATESQLAQRSLATGFNSILQGNGSNVIVNDSVNSAAILDGFIIENGSGGAGAGMQNSYSSPQVRNCVFTNNSTSSAGGGVSCSNSSPIFTNVVFYNNSVTGPTSFGGAMYCANGSYPIIRNCDFVNNHSNFSGGAIYSISNAHPAISNSAFTGNTAVNLYDDNFFGATPNLSHNLLQTGTTGSGNIISAGAGMLDQASASGQDGLWFTQDDGLQLNYSSSNLINRGSNDSVINPITATDILSSPRIQNGTVDIGAYESPVYNYCDSATFNSIHILYVDGNQPVSGNGYSWASAFTTLGEALDKANYCSAFDTVLVAAGTYYPTGYQADTNRNLSFTILRSGYQVIGGYPNGGGVRNRGDNNTVLSGDIGLADTSFDNSYHVLVFRNVDNTSGVDGFIITAGAANSPIGDANGNGGGAWINGSGTGGNCKPRIINCVFMANEAYYGGAVINDGTYGGNSSPTFINCVFTRNTCDLGYGGALYNVASYNGTSMPVITNCTFAENTCSGSGGGIYDDCSISGTVTTTLKNTILWGNTSNNSLADQQFSGSGCTSTASYCIVQGGLSGSLSDGGHNLYVNPQFVDSANVSGYNNQWMTKADGMDIYGGSVAIDAGNALGAPSTDITGAMRFGTPDIGAYENVCGGTVFKTLTIQSCDSVVSPNYSRWLTSTGIYNDTTTTRYGCDTIITLNLTLGHTTTASLTANACNSYTSPSGSYVWDTTGVYTEVLSNATGCDSIVTVNLTVNHGAASAFSASSCGASYNYNGHTYTSGGIYNDTLSTTQGCDSVVTLTLALETINNTASVSGANCTVAETGAGYQWLDCNTNQPVNNGSGQTFTATQNGSYQCIISRGSCTDTTNCVTVSTLGIPEVSTFSIEVYPNPTLGEFNLYQNYNGNLQISITDAIGKLVKETTVTKPIAQLSIQEFAAGVYLLNISSDNKLLKMIKIVKQ